MEKMKSSKSAIDAKPSSEKGMDIQPVFERDYDRRSLKLEDKVAIITGGDSGIGRAVALAFAREGADVAIVYRKNTVDARETRRLIEEKGRRAMLLQDDISKEKNCKKIADKVLKAWGKIDILVNNAAVQYPQSEVAYISEKQIADTFQTNVFAQLFLVQAVLPHLKKGSCIINTSSVTAYRGNPVLLDYSSSKGAVISFTRALSEMLINKGIRVNAVAPGPIWTPLITTTFPPDHVKKFGKDSPMGRPGQPAEVAPAYVFLASEDASYISGQVIHVNGGEVLNT